MSESVLQPPVDVSAGHLARRIFRKVPELTVYFWIVKILTTAMGEATSDYFVHRYNPVIVVILGAAGLAAALTVQFSVRRYIAWVYWLAVAMVAVFGTMAADVVHIALGVPYVASTAFFAASLAVVFALWRAREKTLSIHSICSPRREVFYWATVMATFALGTAVGDMTAVTLHLGYLTSGVLFTILFAIPAVAYFKFGLNEITAFWWAYVLTRPLGASFADWAGVSHSMGGIGLGRGVVSLTLTLLIIALVAFLSITRKDVRDRGSLLNH